MKLQFFLDWGGDILWPADDEAQAVYGSPVVLDQLPISGLTCVRLEALSDDIVSAAESSSDDDGRLHFMLYAVMPSLRAELAAAGIQLMPFDSQFPPAGSPERALGLVGRGEALAAASPRHVDPAQMKIAGVARVRPLDVREVSPQEVVQALGGHIDPAILEVATETPHARFWRGGDKYFFDDPEETDPIAFEELRYDSEIGLWPAAEYKEVLRAKQNPQV